MGEGALSTESSNDKMEKWFELMWCVCLRLFISWSSARLCISWKLVLCCTDTVHSMLRAIDWVSTLWPWGTIFICWFITCTSLPSSCRLVCKYWTHKLLANFLLSAVPGMWFTLSAVFALYGVAWHLFLYLILLWSSSPNPGYEPIATVWF